MPTRSAEVLVEPKPPSVKPTFSQEVFMVAWGLPTLYVTGWAIVWVAGGHYTSLPAALFAIALEGAVGLLLVSPVLRWIKEFKGR